MLAVRSITILLASAMLLVAGCRSKLDVKTEKGAPLPTIADESPEPAVPELPPGPDPSLEPPAPTEKDGGVFLQDQRAVFQTRETIKIRVSADVVAGAETFSLLNVTGGEDDPITILDHEPVPDGMSLLGGGFSLTPVLEGDDMVLSFYPGRPDWRGKFHYGLNKLKLVAHDDANPRFSYVQLTLRDFVVFGGMLTLGDVSDQASAGFQGWLTVVGAPTVSAGGTTLSTGLGPITKQ